MGQGIDIQTGPRQAGGGGLLAAEWLLTNGRGSYASSTVVGVNTRKYHGLLVAAVGSPGERAVLLAALADELVLPGRSVPLACFEFDGVFHPRGDRHLIRFECDKESGTVRWTCRVDEHLTLSKSLVLARDADTIVVRYELGGRPPSGGRPRIRAAPFLAWRHYHANRRAAGQPAVHARWDGRRLILADPDGSLPAMHIEPADGQFTPAADWWYRFFYRAEAERGEDCWEDLFTPGRFELDLDEGSAELRVAVEPFKLHSFAEAVEAQRSHHGQLAELAGPPSPGPASRGDRLLPQGDAGPQRSVLTDLPYAADDFVVQLPGGGATILAGYHWFADWGRDAFVSLPGLLLATGRSEIALAVLTRFAGAIRRGLVPNRFVDASPSEPGGPPPGLSPCDYNSVDASLWFIHAAFAWAEHTARWDTFDAELLGPVRSILDACHAGTDYAIRADDDGLLACGDGTTQLTWMDATVDGLPVTPRAGKPVEVNALYGHALRLMSNLLSARGEPGEAVLRERFARWRASFARKFPSPRGGLYDCIRPDGRPDDSIRPNQLLAVSLDDDLLPVELGRQVVDLARRHLLTPFGLRSLAPGEPGYRGQCVGPRPQRDAAYHQGTVWAWLIGPFLEAYLRVNGFSEDAKRQAGAWLSPLLEHMNTAAGLGQISEIFDGDRPHTPRGCIAQAWSVGEVLRVVRLVGNLRKGNCS